MNIKAPRRVFLAFGAIAIAASILRPQISLALVMRGDDLQFQGTPARAILMYRRAVGWDPNDRTAVDRLCFNETITHNRDFVVDAIVVASGYLKRQPNDAEILFDRALSFEMLRRYKSAVHDFVLSGRLRRDSRTLTFAGFAARRAGERARAHALFAEAMRYDPRYTPAKNGFDKW